MCGEDYNDADKPPRNTYLLKHKIGCDQFFSDEKQSTT